jgi:ArsR family transcriptional regulator
MFKRMAVFPPSDVDRDEATASCDTPHAGGVTAELRDRLMSPAAVAELADTFRLLGDTTRVRILDVLSRSELCVCDLAELLGLTSSAVSHQLRLLRGMRVVRYRRAGRLVYYSLDDEHIVHLFTEALKHVQERHHA